MELSDVVPPRQLWPRPAQGAVQRRARLRHGHGVSTRSQARASLVRTSRSGRLLLEPAGEHRRRPDTGESRRPCPGRRVADGLPYCPVEKGVGWAIRYEQFLSNLFGVYSSVRVLSPPLGDAWITFGPFVETSIGRRANAMIQGGLSFRPYESPRFEMRVTVGLWKPKSHRIGIESAADHGR